MRYANFIFLCTGILCTAIMQAGIITFINNAARPLYIWPVPTKEPAAMAAMLPPTSLPVQFNMNDEFKNMYVVMDEALPWMKGDKINIQDPNAVINWIKNSKLPYIVSLPANKTWMAVGGYHGGSAGAQNKTIGFAELIIKY